jgi:hypothetical protein
MKKRMLVVLVALLFYSCSIAQVVDKQIELSGIKYYLDEEATNSEKKYAQLGADKFIREVFPSLKKLESIENTLKNDSLMIIRDVVNFSQYPSITYYNYLKNGFHSFNFNDSTKAIENYEKIKEEFYSRKMLDLIKNGKYDIVKKLMRSNARNDTANYPQYMIVFKIIKIDSMWHFEVVLIDFSFVFYRHIGDHLKY